MRVRIDQIIPDPHQPRKTFDDEAINQLASSFDRYGIISPLKVRPFGDNQYMIVTGELRYRAAKQRGDKEIEVGDPINLTDQQAREIQFIENLQRSDLSPLELGEAFYNHRKEYNLSQAQLATIVGLGQGTIQGYEIIYTNLSPGNKNYLKSGRLDFTSARAIATIEDRAKQTELGDIATERELTRDTIAKIASMVKAQPGRPVADIIDDVITGKAKEEEMARLEAAKRAAGITIETPEELARAAEALKREAERKAREAMTPEEKAEEERKKLVTEARKSLDSTAKKIDRASGVMDVSQFRERLTTLEETLEKDPAETKAQLMILGQEVTEAENKAKAEVKAKAEEERREKKAEEDRQREERATKRARKQLLEDTTFLGEVLDKAPKELIEEKVFTEEEREILSKPLKPTTIMDKFYELEKQSKKLSDGLAELTEFPPMGKGLLGVALQTLRARIDETLQRMGIEVIEGEAKLIDED